MFESNQHQLIDIANDINDYRIAGDFDEVTDKELKKIELYCRKTFLMIRHTHKLMEGDHEVESFMKDLSKALVRDYNYVKTRDNMDDYVI